MDNKEIIISFYPGCSGNFLAAVISDSHIVRFDRIDNYIEDQKFDSNYRNNLKYSGINDFDNIPLDHATVIVTHESDIKKIKSIFPNYRIIRILPISMIFNALYNVFHKKILDENRSDIMSSWPSNPAYCYDMSLESLKDFYRQFITDKNFEDAIILDFGVLQDKNQLVEFLHKINVKTTANTEILIDNYLKNQLPINLESIDSPTMEDIVSSIPDRYFFESPWFVAYCIFRFELVNQPEESQRLWTIDQLTLLDKPNLIKISYQYNFNRSF
jgi:hypothetical protein